VEVMEAALPPRLSAISRKEKPLHPYAAVVVGAAGTDVGCGSGLPCSARRLRRRLGRGPVACASGAVEGSRACSPCRIFCESSSPRWLGLAVRAAVK